MAQKFYVTSVNGVSADAQGNVTVSGGGGGGGGASRFGIEDNTGVQDRVMNMQGNKFSILGSSTLYLGTNNNIGGNINQSPGGVSLAYNAATSNLATSTLTLQANATTYESLALTTNGITRSGIQMSPYYLVFTGFQDGQQLKSIEVPKILGSGSNLYMPVSVNGNFADYTGNITIATGGGGGGGAGWALTGNAATNPLINFIGTTDDVDFKIKRNNQDSLTFKSGNNVLFTYVSPSLTGTGNFTAVYAGLALTTGSNNILMGTFAGYSMTTGSNNIGLGFSSLFKATTGVRNIGIGGASNTFSTLTGSDNIIIGSNSGLEESNFTADASRNIAIGPDVNNYSLAGSSRSTGNSNIIIGDNIQLQSISGSNQLNIGNAIFGKGLTGIRRGISPAFIGIKDNNPTHTLSVAGDFKLVDGTQGAGKVLTSDASGGSSWQIPAASGGTGGATVTADSGLTKTLNNIQLGGALALNRYTTIGKPKTTPDAYGGYVELSEDTQYKSGASQIGANSNNSSGTIRTAGYSDYYVDNSNSGGEYSSASLKTEFYANGVGRSASLFMQVRNGTANDSKISFLQAAQGFSLEVVLPIPQPGSGNFSRILPLSVNGSYADATGNITIAAGGGGSTLSLTTTGTSGAATYNSGTTTLNIPIPSEFWIEVTKAQLDTLISSNSLIKGATYRINGVHPGLYNDGVTNTTLVVIQAIANNKLSSEGHGLFYNPLYTATAPFNIWNNRNTFVASGIVGKFNQFEAITNNLGGTATLTTIAEEGFFTITAGTWVGATTITGNTTGATANIASIVIKSFAIGEKTIWGGYVWSNINGNVGASTNSLNLNTEWNKIAYNTIDYDLVTDNIDYSYSDDKITRRVDIVSDNEVVYTAGDIVNNAKPFHAINVFQWGNKYTGTKGTGANDVINSYVDNVNNQATYFSKNVFEQNSYYTNNTSIGSGVYNNIFTSGAFMNLNFIGKGSAIFTNHFGLGAAIRQNDLYNNSFIYNNRFSGAGYIGSNKCLGFVAIRENEATGDSYIFSNTIRGGAGFCQIYGNSLFRAAYIRNNTIDTTSTGNGSSFTIMNNVMYGGTGNFVRGFNNSTNPAIIGYNTITGYGQIVENQIMSGEISYCNLTNSLINRCFLRNSSFLRNIVSTGIHVQRLEIGGLMVDYNNVPLTSSSEDAKYTQLENVYPISKTFDGSIDNGAIGLVNINNFTVPIGYFIKEVLVDVGTGLTGAGAIINFGLTVDSANSGLNDITGDIAQLNSAGITVVYPTSFTKAAGIRRMYMEIKGAAITAGTITIKVKLTKLG